MENNLFGNPVTNSVLEGMSEYAGKTITRRDRAHVALNLKNEDEKYRKARKYVEDLKKEWRNGASTLCLIYNATGDTLTLVNDHHWHGYIGHVPFPNKISNGQWGAFLHVKTCRNGTGSSGAVVYRGLNKFGSVYEWMASWSNTWNQILSGNNTVYTEIVGGCHYENYVRWNNVFDKLENGKQILRSSYKGNGCVSNVTITNGTPVIFEATFTLEGADYKN